ncbi:MAG: quinol:cytochrome C oxidoreductase [Planctomycetes bacterium]|nr:quinol:cytochrome C oxidoreductase [Planctomycetota bacterium]
MNEHHSSTAPLGSSGGHAPILDRLAQRGLLLGGAGLIGGLGLGLLSEGGFQRFMGSYVIAYAFVLAIALGALGFVIIQHLTRAGWSVTNRRIAELIASTMPLLALLFLPIVLNHFVSAHPVHPWANSEFAHSDPLIAKKASYLNTGFFLVRWAIYFAVWVGLSRFFLGTSLKQDESGDPRLTIKMEKMAAPSVLLFGLSLSFAAFDLLMSLDPHWFSTIFGVYYFAGCMMSFFATCILLGKWLQKSGAIGAGEITTEHRHDLGKFMFGFVVFWSYIAFSQFMLIWYANNPEETGWYDVRQNGAMGYFSIALIFIHFVIPFLGLLSRHVKRHPVGLPFWACWLLFAQWLDLFFIVVPSVQQWMNHGHADHGHGDAAHAASHAADHAHEVFPFALSDLLTPIGLAGLALFFFARRARAVALTPKLDPRRQESLSLQNI